MRLQASRSKGGANDGQLKQARQKTDKLDRIGLYREDGKAFKLHALKTLDEDAVRLPTKIHEAAAPRTLHFEFPTPHPPLRRAPDDVILQLDNAAVGYGPAPPHVLSGVTLQLTARTRAALCGSNGAGKSSLLAVLHGALAPVAGSMTKSAGVRCGWVAQHHAESLPLHASPAAFLSETFSVPVRAREGARTRAMKGGGRGGWDASRKGDEG
jgi:ATPase subunit of ABC transporter with duplicated ATPase domains